MNKSSIKPIIALAILSFMLTLFHYGSVNPSFSEQQSSINTAVVKESLNAERQFYAPGANLTAGTVAVLSAGIIFISVLSSMKSKNSFKLSLTVPRSSSRYSPKSPENTIRFEHANRELQHKLLRLLHNDRGAAFRLLSHVKMKNPGKSTNWYFEKVIYDLERDRGR